MIYYCGQCVIKHKKLVQLELKISGLAVVYICPVCKENKPMTVAQATYALRSLDTVEKFKAVKELDAQLDKEDNIQSGF